LIQLELRKQIAISIAQFLLNEVQVETDEKPVDLYMKWKTKYNVKLRHPETAKYALRIFTELGNMTQRERNAFAEATRLEMKYASRES
jgi:hypothetical protein